MWPNSVIVRAYMFRGAKLWLLLRTLLTGLFLLGGSPSILLPVSVLCGVVALSVFLAFLDTYRYRERVLLGNLGVRPVVLGMLFLIPAAIGETTLRAGWVLFQ